MKYSDFGERLAAINETVDWTVLGRQLGLSPRYCPRRRLWSMRCPFQPWSGGGYTTNAAGRWPRSNYEGCGAKGLCAVVSRADTGVMDSSLFVPEHRLLCSNCEVSGSALDLAALCLGLGANGALRLLSTGSWAAPLDGQLALDFAPKRRLITPCNVRRNATRELRPGQQVARRKAR